MSRKVLVAGVGMVPFAKPGKSDSYDVMGANATNAALQDAGLTFDAIPQAYAGSSVIPHPDKRRCTGSG
jgi:hypothetical protein